MRTRPRFLAKVVTNPSQHINYAFDMEWKRETGEIIEASVGNLEEQCFVPSIPAMLAKMEELNSAKARFYCHWGDGAEFTHLVHAIINDPDLFKRYRVETVMQGEDRVIAMKLTYTIDIGKRKPRLKQCTLFLADTFALIPTGLEKMSETFAPDYKKLKGEGPDFKKEDYDPTKHRKYLQRDVQAVVASIENFSALIYELFGCAIGLTAASTAMKAFKASITEGHVYYRVNKGTEKWLRQGYYGAYTHPGFDNKLHTDVVCYDITGAYGKQMKSNVFPVGNPIWTTTFRAQYQGIWKVEATPLKPTLPIVPYKDKDGVKWLGDVAETITTYLTTEEIIFAEKHNYSFKIIEGYYFKRSEQVFKEFIEKCEMLEREGGVKKEIGKLMRNSCYGKFASRDTAKRLIVCDDAYGTEKGYVPYMLSSGELVPGLYVSQEEVDAEYIMPHWGAYITAFQRLAIMKLAFIIGPEHNLGIDTDSIKMELDTFMQHTEDFPLIEDFNGLKAEPYQYGYGKVENFFQVFRSHGPKNYVYIKGGKPGLKLKGIPKSFVTDEQMLMHLYRAMDEIIPVRTRNQNDPFRVNYTSITRTSAMLKSGCTQQFTIHRFRTLNTLHSTKWYLDEQACFHPQPPIVKAA